MNKQTAARNMHNAVANQYGLRFVEAKLTDRPWISIFSKTISQEISPVAQYQIKEGYAAMFNMDVDELRIKVFPTRVVVFDLNRVKEVQVNNEGLISWKYIRN